MKPQETLWAWNSVELPGWWAIDMGGEGGAGRGMAGSPQAKDKEALSSLPGPTYGYLYSKMNLKRSAFLNSVSPSSKLLNLRGSWEPRVHRHKLGQKYRPEVWVACRPQGASGVWSKDRVVAPWALAMCVWCRRQVVSVGTGLRCTEFGWKQMQPVFPFVTSPNDDLKQVTFWQFNCGSQNRKTSFRT